MRSAIAKCPFLHSMGPAAAEGLVERRSPFQAPGAGSPEERLAATVRQVHGPGGAVPLKRFSECPAGHVAQPEQQQPAPQSCAAGLGLGAPEPAPRAARRAAGLPVASMSLSFGNLVSLGRGHCS